MKSKAAIEFTRNYILAFGIVIGLTCHHGTKMSIMVTVNFYNAAWFWVGKK